MSNHHTIRPKLKLTICTNVVHVWSISSLNVIYHCLFIVVNHARRWQVAESLEGCELKTIVSSCFSRAVWWLLIYFTMLQYNELSNEWVVTAHTGFSLAMAYILFQSGALYSKLFNCHSHLYDTCLIWPYRLRTDLPLMRKMCFYVLFTCIKCATSLWFSFLYYISSTVELNLLTEYSSCLIFLVYNYNNTLQI